MSPDPAQRAAVARSAAQALRDAADLPPAPVLVGFDGFIDAIAEVVDVRYDEDHHKPMDTIATFGGRVAAAAGKSSNFELVVKTRKIGGNGPIMALALAKAGLGVTYVGNLGVPAPDPVFEPLQDLAHAVYSVAPAGATDALEFEDGKLMLGKHSMLGEITAERIRQTVGDEVYDHAGAHARLIAMVNWTMLPHMNAIWEDLRDKVLPQSEHRPWVFIDLADPAKRTADDLKTALELAGTLQARANVAMGFNLSESVQAAGALGVEIDGDAEAAIETTARALRERLGVSAVVVHPRSSAAAAIKGDDGEVASARFAGPWVGKPKLSTGAGDNFNAGFSHGLVLGLDVAQCLCLGVGTSGFYVREARSPTR
ncbi:MAG: carbohydrate kinase family protein, partial [Planctomycetota bacterium]